MTYPWSLMATMKKVKKRMNGGKVGMFAVLHNVNKKLLTVLIQNMFKIRALRGTFTTIQ